MQRKVQNEVAYRTMADQHWICAVSLEGLVRDLNPGPLAPKARIIPLDQRAVYSWQPSVKRLFPQATSLEDDLQYSQRWQFLLLSQETLSLWKEICMGKAIKLV